MANRVTQPDVEEILLREFVTGDVLAPFINVANKLTDWLEDKDTDNELTSDDLTNIELYLSAHFYAAASQRFSDKKTDKASAKFQGTTEKYLDYTDYGQMALLLDTTGLLAKRNQETKDGGKKEVQLLFIGEDDD